MEPTERLNSAPEGAEPQSLTRERLRLSRLGRLGAFPGPEIYEAEEEAKIGPSETVSACDKKPRTSTGEQEA